MSKRRMKSKRNGGYGDRIKQQYHKAHEPGWSNPATPKLAKMRARVVARIKLKK